MLNVTSRGIEDGDGIISKVLEKKKNGKSVSTLIAPKTSRRGLYIFSAIYLEFSIMQSFFML